MTIDKFNGRTRVTADNGCYLVVDGENEEDEDETVVFLDKGVSPDCITEKEREERSSLYGIE